MTKIADKPIRLKNSLVKSVKKENCLTKSEVTWLLEELRKRGSNIAHNTLVDLIDREYTCRAIYQPEVDLITEYLLSKRTLVRKFIEKLETLKPNNANIKPIH